MENKNSEEKENNIDDTPSIDEIITRFTSLIKIALKLFGLFLGGYFLSYTILDKIIDFNEHESFTLNGIEYGPTRKNASEEERQLYSQKKKEYFDLNNVSFYGRYKSGIPTIIILLGVGLVGREFLFGKWQNENQNHPT